jgi:SNF family Na+-dependent transporter
MSPVTVSPAVPVYAGLSFWRAVLDRAVRNAIQTLIPTLVAAQVGTIVGVDWTNLLYVAAIAGGVTVVKALVQVATDTVATSRTPLVWRLLDRAIPAAGAVLISFATLNGSDAAPVVDWRAAWIATVAAALAAVAQAYVSPAASLSQKDHTLAA